MNKAAMLKIVNPILGIAFITQAFSGIFHDLVQGWSYDMWKLVHATGGYVFVSLVIVHFSLNWNWIRNNFLPKVKK